MSLPPLRRSSLSSLVHPDSFFWSAGIEDTFITDPWPLNGRTLDEYELTDHYRQQEDDFQKLASLGIKVVRYGIPWYRVNPAPGVWDLEWVDKSIDSLLKLGITPVIDLVHYGLPRWIEGSYFNELFPIYFAEYAEKVATHLKGRVYAYTSLNEPRITAWYCGKLGWWPPFAKGWAGFSKVLLQITLGMSLVDIRLRAVDPEIIVIHVDASDLYTTEDQNLVSEMQKRQEINFLPLDLISGKVVPGHLLYDWLVKLGSDEITLNTLSSQGRIPDIIGFNLYPMFSHKQLYTSKNGLRIRMNQPDPDLIPILANKYYDRYKKPLMITETASRRSIKQRSLWLRTSVEAVRRTRLKNIPLIGYTWWPVFGMIGWAYRQGQKPLDFYIEQMGLWDLTIDPQTQNIQRLSTPLVDEYQELVKTGIEAVGALG